MTARTVVRAVGMLIVAGVLASCGIEPDSEPRDIGGDRQAQLADVGRGNDQTPAGGSRIYLLDGADAQNPVVRAVARPVASDPSELIGALLEGPTASERERRLRTAIPVGTTLHHVNYEGPGTVTIDLSAGILEASGDSLVSAVAQIVYTLGQLDNIKGVQLKVDGESRQWPTGDGTLTGAPLTVYMYPGRAASTQPDYPALPSATPATTTA